MDTQEKKFLIPVIRTYGDDLSRRWRIEWDVPTHNGLKFKRKVLYGGINRGKTVDERFIYASNLIRKLLSNEPDPLETKASLSDDLDQVVQLNTVNWRPSSLRVYKTVLSVFRAFLNGIRFEDVTAETIRAFILHLKDSRASQHKIYKYISLLKSLFTKAVDLGYLKANPVPKTGLKKARSRSLLFFTDNQIQKIKGAVMPRELWLCIQLLYYCFIRPGESRLLKIGDLNFQYGFIEIPAHVSKNKKTQKVSIPVPLCSSLEYLSKYPDNYYLIGLEGIPSTDPIPEKRLYHLHKRILSTVEINGRYSLYSWKHTGVVKAVKAGINIKDLQMQLRHHSLDMVNEYLKNLGVLDSDEIRNNFPSI